MQERPPWEEFPFVTSGFFAWRTPFLPFDELLAFSQGLAAPAAGNDPEALLAALTADRTLLRERLRTWVSRPWVREALFLASPALDEGLDRALRPGEPEDDEQTARVERTVLRYLSRMAGRATPFGLFAGCSLGQLGPRTQLVLEARHTYRRSLRLDMDFLWSLVESVERDPAFRETASYRPSPDLYRAAGRLRVLESLQVEKQRVYRLSSVEPTLEVERVLAWSASGARRSELIAALVAADPELAASEAQAFIDALIDSRLLVPGLALPVTGDQPLVALVRHLREHSPVSEVAEALSRTREALSQLDAQGPGAMPERYRAIAGGLKHLPAPPELAQPFNADLIKPAAEAVLGPEVLKELQRGVRLLHRLHGPESSWELRRFREAFVERYGEQEVPLLEALDEESGIGFSRDWRDLKAEASPLLEGLEFPSRGGEAAWTSRDTWLLRRLHELERAGQRELVLDEEALKALERRDAPPLPDAFSVFAAVAAPSTQSLEEGHFRIRLDYACGPSGAVLLGRFCHADARLLEQVRLHLRAEERLQPEAVFAEIAHLPAGRAGNILLRPLLREYEIPYLGGSGAPPEQQIPLEDLRVSVRGERVLLRSARLGRQVLPRLTAAHNFQNDFNTGTYRFLCALQTQGVAATLAWSWGPLAQAPFLPRVRAGRLVLSRARWRLGRKELEELARKLGGAPGGAAYSAIQGLKERLGLPRWIALAEGDNELPLDLDNVLSAECLASLLKSRKDAILMEVFPGPDELLARGPEGRFVHELILPFVRAERREPLQPSEGRLPVSMPPAVRRFAPGSEWLFIKLYCGTASAERVLAEAVTPVVREALATGAADGWFFIRYGDPDWHLRLRLHGDPQRLLTQVLPALHEVTAPLLADGAIHRILLDTYEREVERYGGAVGIELMERWFQADSEAALELIAALPGDGDGRWQIALSGADALLADLGLPPPARLQVLAQARQAFGREFRVGGRLERQLGERYRKERAHLVRLMAREPIADEALTAGRAVLRRRSEKLAPIAAALREAEAAGRLSVPIPELAQSLLHMQMNRLLRAAARAQECVLYDFLHRLYRSQAARKA